MNKVIIYRLANEKYHKAKRAGVSEKIAVEIREQFIQKNLCQKVPNSKESESIKSPLE